MVFITINNLFYNLTLCFNTFVVNKKMEQKEIEEGKTVCVMGGRIVKIVEKRKCYET